MNPPPSPSIMPTAADAMAESKKALRVTSLARRRSLPVPARAKAAGEAVTVFLDAVRPPAGEPVAGYWPMRGELDPRPLMANLAASGHPLLLPVITGDGQPLTFRAWREGDLLTAGPFGTREPPADAPEGLPGLVIVPVLAFDDAGYRLGYGGGFYDRTLAELRRRRPGVIAAGFAYESQRSANLPRDDWDQQLDWIVTERAARKTR